MKCHLTQKSALNSRNICLRLLLQASAEPSFAVSQGFGGSRGGKIGAFPPMLFDKFWPMVTSVQKLKKREWGTRMGTKPLKALSGL